jgi:thioredoxin 1
MPEIILTKDNFDQEVLKSKVPVLIDFWANWCGPCQAMKPIIEELAKEIDTTKFKIGTLNVDENQELAQKFNIMSIPNFLFFKDGKVVDSLLGIQSKDELKNKLESLVK